MGFECKLCEHTMGVKERYGEGFRLKMTLYAFPGTLLSVRVLGEDAGLGVPTIMDFHADCVAMWAKDNPAEAFEYYARMMEGARRLQERETKPV